MMDPNWPRWIKASCRTWFDNQRQGITIFYSEDSERESRPSDYSELRVNGPDISEHSKGCYTLDVEVNIIVVSIKNDKDADILERNVGIFINAFVDINVFRFGDGLNDDGSYVGCLVLDDKRPLEITNFGQIQPETRMIQTSIDGLYHMYLEN